MREAGWFPEAWLGSVLEKPGDGLEQVRLIGFDREVIMGLSLGDQIGSEGALGQQGIGGDSLALQVDGIQQRGRRFDLVGALALVEPFYGQGPDFF
jgi:hypothetical protein